MHRNEAVSSERLVDTLWGETPPPTAAKVLQNYVSQLRRALGDRDGRRLQTRGHGYALRVDDGELDLDRFERLVGEHGGSLAHDRPAEAAVRLREALALWRGPPLADVAYEAFAEGEIARLEERRSVALEQRIDADLALGRHADLVAELEALIAERPLREHLRGQRMLALYRCGRQAEALEAFRETRRLLVDEVGVEPGPELQRLHEAILRHDASLELELKAHELPRELDAAAAPALVGRERELAWLRERWERARGGVGGLIVLVGEPGIGKTRLAAELAGEVHRVGAVVLYAAGGESSEAVVDAIRRARQATRPTLLVVDDADANDGALAGRIEAVRELATKQVLTVVTSQGSASLGPESSLALDPLDADAVRRIALLYAPGDAAWDIPADELLEASRGVPGRVHEVASAWARREATRRLVAFAPRAAAGRSELRAAEAQVAGGVIDLQAVHERADLLAEREAPVVCPFKGLASFDVADAKYFFGRERLVAELVARAVGAPLLGVVGPSGSGKSSVVHAGLLPALADGVLPGSDHWPQLVVRPGEHPMGELHSARFNADTDRGIVLVVDQFEELFSACRDEHERAAFIDTLVRAARGRHGGGVVLAVRADFYGRCAAYPALSKLLGANHVLVGPMRSDELHRAIELPARRVGLEVEPELVAALVTDVEGEPGALPLLFTALLELWQDRDGRRLRHATYERTGGVHGAVARMAEEAYGGLDVADRARARRLLLRLADEGEGGAVVRRRVALAELEGQGDEDLARVLAALTERRLLTMSATTVEVAHEALLREWPRLRGWLEEDAQGRRTQRRLTDAAHEWDERGRDAGELYRGARLAVALEWRDGHEHELNATERAFLDAGRTAAGRAQRRLRLALAGVAALLAVAVLGALLALHQRSTARTEARLADAQRISVQALTEGDLDRSLLLARQGFALADTPITRGNLLAALLRRPAAIAVVRGEGTALSAIDLARDGRTLVVGGSHGGVEFFDAVTRRRIALPATIGTSIVSLRFSPDGTRVAVARYDRLRNPRIELLDAHSRRSLGDLDL
ncbi:MAG TPA: BTAD domain-containing putative transcriptional regulator, partial [Solirubrobacteraceae bacterium]